MAKITVNDIVTAAKDVKRYTNYANRHMYNQTNIVEVNKAVNIARKAMANLEREFLDKDISELTGFDPQLESEINSCEREIEWLEGEIRDGEGYLDDDDLTEDEVESVREEIEEYKKRLNEYSDKLDKLIASR